MKALSVRQPWASLIVSGEKTIEIRSWRPKTMSFPQRICIHAGQRPDKEMSAQIAVRRDLPRGALIGEITITGVIRYTEEDQWLKDGPRHLSLPNLYKKGLYGFVLSEPRPYPVPVRFTGRLGFFDIPPDLLF